MTGKCPTIVPFLLTAMAYLSEALFGSLSQMNTSPEFKKKENLLPNATIKIFLREHFSNKFYYVKISRFTSNGDVVLGM